MIKATITRNSNIKLIRKMSRSMIQQKLLCPSGPTKRTEREGVHPKINKWEMGDGSHCIIAAMAVL